MKTHHKELGVSMASVTINKGNSRVERGFKVIAVGLLVQNIHRLLLSLSLIRGGAVFTKKLALLVF